MDKYSANVRREDDSLILDTNVSGAQFYAQAFNPDTCVVELYPIQSVTRHATPERMYRLQTACGRAATLTGDHNLWVLRNGHLQLIETADARSDDYVPVPEVLLAEGDLESFDTLQVLADKKLFVEAPGAMLAYAGEGGSPTGAG
jgi:intein/homing endonuclease